MPGDSYDFTSTQQITLARLTIGGVDRDVLMQAPKNGMFYVIDRRTGKLLSARNYAQVTWTTGVDPATGRPQFTENAFYDKGPKEIMPWSFGAHSWQPMSFSPRTGLVYIPVMQHPASYMQDPAYRFTPGRMNLAIAAGPPSTAEIGGALIAWDPVAQREVWRVRQPEIWNGGALSTAANLVFAGNAHGEFSAYRATDGQRLWMYRQGAAIMGGPITYSVGGVQYVAVIAGYGGGQPLMIADMSRPRKVQPMGRMLVFRLDGKAVIQDEELAVPPPNPPDESFTPQQIATGAGLYYRHCIFCHGGSVLPDLRRAGPLRDGKVWNQIVIGGLLSANGMDSFAQWLSAADAEAIRAYVGTEARELAESDAKRGAVR
jgi:quinohemoprotein ethanol dehydrogenase